MTAAPPPTRSPGMIAFADERMAGLILGLVAMVPFLLPRLELAGKWPAQYHYGAGQLALYSVWGGFLACAPALVARMPARAVGQFLAGWAFAAAGVGWVNPREHLPDRLYDAQLLLGLTDHRHVMYWLDMVTRITEAMLSVAGLAVLQGWLVGARPARIAGAVLAVSAPLPLLWLLAAAQQAILPIRVLFAHTVAFFLLLAHFALWGVLPWWILRRRGKPVARPADGGRGDLLTGRVDPGKLCDRARAGAVEHERDGPRGSRCTGNRAFLFP